MEGQRVRRRNSDCRLDCSRRSLGDPLPKIKAACESTSGFFADISIIQSRLNMDKLKNRKLEAQSLAVYVEDGLRRAFGSDIDVKVVAGYTYPAVLRVYLASNQRLSIEHSSLINELIKRLEDTYDLSCLSQVEIKAYQFGNEEEPCWKRTIQVFPNSRHLHKLIHTLLLAAILSAGVAGSIHGIAAYLSLLTPSLPTNASPTSYETESE